MLILTVHWQDMCALRRAALLLATLVLAAPQLRVRAATAVSIETAGNYRQHISSSQETHIESLRKAWPLQGTDCMLLRRKGALGCMHACKACCPTCLLPVLRFARLVGVYRCA